MRRQVECYNFALNKTSDGCNQDEKPVETQECYSEIDCTPTVTPVIELKTTTQIEEQVCKDIFNKSICEKVKYSNRCTKEYFKLKCCHTCIISD